MNIAVLDDNVVINVIEAESVEFAQNLLGKTCLEITEEFPSGIGWTYDSINNICIPPKPFASWVLSPENTWEAPVPYPTPKEGAGEIVWDEETVSWIEHSA